MTPEISPHGSGAVVEGPGPGSSAVGRPVFATWRLGLLGAYWLGVTAMWIGLASLLAGRLQYQHLVAPGTEGASLLQMTVAGTLVAIVVQPAVGSISDHTASRWGRRLPYIVVGSLLDLAFLAGIAASRLRRSSSCSS